MVEQPQKHHFFLYAPYRTDEDITQKRLSLFEEHKDRLIGLRKTGFISCVLVLSKKTWRGFARFH